MCVGKGAGPRAMAIGTALAYTNNIQHVVNCGSSTVYLVSI